MAWAGTAGLQSATAIFQRARALPWHASALRTVARVGVAGSREGEGVKG